MSVQVTFFCMYLHTIERWPSFLCPVAFLFAGLQPDGRPQRPVVYQAGLHHRWNEGVPRGKTYELQHAITREM
ncbi:hypothetical protein K523DRAFT_323998 [Schizophyllum commune Tattone D]|nr:hypothetical protein K523DRAFT_323998 [Schizophyllum commune Tattone D]